MDSQGVGCARCGGSPAVPSEKCHINEETKSKLLAHADELKAFGVTLEKREPLTKISDHAIGLISLALGVSESLHPGTLRSLVLFLRNLAIPEEQILRLRLDEPENISKILSEQPDKGKRQSL